MRLDNSNDSIPTRPMKLIVVACIAHEASPAWVSSVAMDAAGSGQVSPGWFLGQCFRGPSDFRVDGYGVMLSRRAQLGLPA